jgi:hypothetical protein
LGVITSPALVQVGYILLGGCHIIRARPRRRRVGAKPMHPTLSPALVRTLAGRGSVAIMISQKSLKAGAEIEWSSWEHFGGLELKTARAATVPSGSTCPTAPVALGYHLRRRRRLPRHAHLANLACFLAMKSKFRSNNRLNTPPLCPTSCPAPLQLPRWPCIGLEGISPWICQRYTY